jgi:regulator of PEP synthase PpsR (kinase-PPPase family)
MNENEGSDYADQETITQELNAARRLFNAHNWPVIDVSRRSVEETAAEIINLHSRWIEEQAEKDSS